MPGSETAGSGRGGVLSLAAGHPSGHRLPSRGVALAAPWPRSAAPAGVRRSHPPPLRTAPPPLPLPSPRAGPSLAPHFARPRLHRKSPSPSVPVVGSLGSWLRCLPIAPLKTSANPFYFPFNFVNGRKNRVHRHLISQAGESLPGCFISLRGQMGCYFTLNFPFPTYCDAAHS